MTIAKTNGELLQSHYSLVLRLACVRLELLRTSDPVAVRECTASQLIELGLCDEVRVFVKNELHSDKKLAEGRMRIIMSISVIDQIVERVLNAAQNNAEIGEWEDVPSKPGMGLDDESLHKLRAQMHALGPNPVATDVSGFDWAVPAWLLESDTRMRIWLTGAKGSIADLFNNRCACLLKSRFLFSNGESWDQQLPGIQKSGSYNTSSSNSRMRVMLAHMVASKFGEDGNCIAMGDDAVENNFAPRDSAHSRPPLAPLKEAYAEYGFTVKEASYDLEFCAYSFKPSGFEPVRWQKMLAGLLATSPRDDAHETELLVALAYELRHSPHKHLAMEIIRASGWGARKDVV